MKTLVIIIDQPRNLSLLKKLCENKKVNVDGLVLYKAKNPLPEPDEKLSEELKKLWNLHFKKRYLSEKKFFGLDKSITQKIEKKIFVNNVDEFRGKKVFDFIKSINAEACFVAGTPIIKDPIFSILPNNKVNLHLGLIPHYKGTITMFWPFYFLEPSMAGTTYHIIDKFVDTGEIIHQNVPNLSYGDGMHDVACKAVMAAVNDLDIVVDEIIRRIKYNIKPKKDISLSKKGRLLKDSDWKPEMLKKIYNIYDDKIVDLYLNNKIKCPKPSLAKIKQD